MMNAKTKDAIRARLRRIGGQVQAVERMVDADRPHSDLVHQLSAVQAAISKAAELMLQSYLQTWVTDAIRSGDERECRRHVDEMVTVLGRLRRIRAR
jgi:DNA-binding FrmR family transcriptional regulator